MKLFDLHCDTLGEIYRRKETMTENTCHISLDKALSVFDEYSQVMAVWSEHGIDGEENYKRCLLTLDYAEKYIKNISGFTPILAVEGGKLLCGRLERLSELQKRGVKIFTLVWKGDSCIGGAYDNDNGLSDFGKEVTDACFSLGIVPDLSHANDKIAEEAFALAKKHARPMIASHSCSRAVFEHRRNLSDASARAVAESGGVIGVNFVTEHIGGRALDDILLHIEHFKNIAGASAVCLGGDLDGISDDFLPDGIENIASVPILFDAIAKKYHSETFAEDVFYSNARNFSKNNHL